MQSIMRIMSLVIAMIPLKGIEQGVALQILNIAVG
jgi:hypothetical protein